jgi:hypothetical protein
MAALGAPCESMKLRQNMEMGISFAGKTGGYQVAIWSLYPARNCSFASGRLVSSPGGCEGVTP